MSVKVRWENTERVARNIGKFGGDARKAVVDLLKTWERQIEAYAKQNAKWRDRTGNARQNLFSHTDDEGNSIKLYLSHRMDYGLWLELKYSGRYAIVMPTLQAHERQIMDSVRRLFQ